MNSESDHIHEGVALTVPQTAEAKPKRTIDWLRGKLGLKKRENSQADSAKLDILREQLGLPENKEKK